MTRRSHHPTRNHLTMPDMPASPVHTPSPHSLVAPDEELRIQALDVDTLRRELAAALVMSARHLAYLAVVWRELELRGEDLSTLRTGLAAYLPLIAAGRLDAEVVVHLAGRTMLLRAVATLSVPDQRRLLAGAPVMVVMPDDEAGGFARRPVPLIDLTSSQVRLAIDAGRMRPVEEQEAVLLRESGRRGRRRSPQKKLATIDRASGKIRIASRLVDPGELIAALAELYGRPEDQDPETTDLERPSQVPVPLTEPEHRALRIRAAMTGVPMGHLVRAAVIAAGLLAPVKET